MMTTMMSSERKRLHPHKFTMWVALASIVMMFAGLTSAYIVKRANAQWIEFRLPAMFWYSTAVILVSSVTLHLAVKSLKVREMSRYRVLMALSAALGIAFIVMQLIGFRQIEEGGLPLFGSDSNPSASFVGIIGGLHGLHVLGGVVALIVLFLRAYFGKKRVYSSTGLEIASTYWHFVGALWVYLFIFFNWI
ncbi:MAG TPA: heme-copper oxidase subunit III [Chitinophagaceae bacterium]